MNPGGADASASILRGADGLYLRNRATNGRILHGPSQRHLSDGSADQPMGPVRSAASAVSCASCRIRARLTSELAAAPLDRLAQRQDPPASVIVRSAGLTHSIRHGRVPAQLARQAHPKPGGSAGDLVGPVLPRSRLHVRAPTAALLASPTAQTPPQLTLACLRHCRPTERSPPRISVCFAYPLPIAEIRCATQTREYPTTGHAAAASGGWLDASGEVSARRLGR